MAIHSSAPDLDLTPPLPDVLGGFDLTDQRNFAGGVPYDLFARLRAHDPVLRHPPGRSADGESFWVLTRHADIARVAADPDFSSQGGGGRAGGGSHLDDLPVAQSSAVCMMMDDPRHALVRRLLARAMTGDAIAALRAPLRAHIGALLDEAVARRSVNVADVAENLAITAMAQLLGVPRRDWDRLLGWGHTSVGFFDRRTGVADDRSAGTFRAMLEYFTGLLAAKRDEPPGPDLSSVLAHGRLPAQPGVAELSDEERAANLTLLLVSGLEQPRNTVAGGVLALAEHPAQWAALRADRALLPTAVEEVLRWNPPNPYNRRTAVRDTEIAGQPVRAGEKVTLWWPSANRDGAVFPAADAFDVARSPNPHLSFGAGTHHCLGDEFARMLLRAVLEELLDRVTVLRLDGTVGRAPNNKHTVLLEVPVELVP